MAKALDSRIENLASLLFTELAKQEKFSQALKNKASGRSVRLTLDGNSFERLPHVPKPWTDVWSISESNISDDNSYSLDLSSIFMVSPLIEVRDKLKEIYLCDACASPGGKSLLAYELLKPKVLLANEKSPQRIKALISNFSKFKLKNAAIVISDLKNLKNYLADTFEVVLLDAPCSGQSLISRGVNNPSSLTRISMDRSSNTQKGLIANAAKMVRPQGYMLYSTCTYSKDENERVIEWFLRKNPTFSALEVPHLAAFKSSLTDLNCYRLWPYENLGSGGFCCLLKNLTEDEEKERFDLEGNLGNIVWKSF